MYIGLFDMCLVQNRTEQCNDLEIKPKFLVMNLVEIWWRLENSIKTDLRKIDLEDRAKWRFLHLASLNLRVVLVARSALLILTIKHNFFISCRIHDIMTQEVSNFRLPCF